MGNKETLIERDKRFKKRKKVYTETYTKGTFMPNKKLLCNWIMQDDVCLRVLNGGRLDDGKEFTTITIEGFDPDQNPERSVATEDAQGTER